MKTYKSLVLVLALIYPIALAAAENSWYVGVSGGTSTADDFPTTDDIRDFVGEQFDLAYYNFPQGISQDDTDTLWKVIAGYQFNPYIGLEMFYADLGEASAEWAAADASGFPWMVGATVGGSLDYSARTSGMYVVASYPLDTRSRAYVKAGAHYYDAEGTSRVFSEFLTQETSFSKAIDDSGTGFAFGAGLEYNFTSRWGATFDWERFNGIDFNGFDIATESLSAGLLFRF